MPQLPIGHRAPSAKDAEHEENATQAQKGAMAEAGRRVFIDAVESFSLTGPTSPGGGEPIKVKVKNTFIDGLASEAQGDASLGELGGGRRQSRTKTMPARLMEQVPAQGEQDDDVEEGSDSEETQDNRLELQESTPFTTRFAQQPAYEGAAFLMPAMHQLPPRTAYSAPTMVPKAAPSEPSPASSPATRQVTLQVPLEVPGSFATTDDLSAVVTSARSVFEGKGCMILDLRVTLNSPGGGSSLSTATPASGMVTLSPAPSAATSWASPASGTPAGAWPAGVVISPASGAPGTRRPSGQQGGTKHEHEEGKSTMVCCHWKNKGFCKLSDMCKFMHPPEKKGVGSTRGKAAPSGGDGSMHLAMSTAAHNKRYGRASAPAVPAYAMATTSAPPSFFSLAAALSPPVGFARA